MIPMRRIIPTILLRGPTAVKGRGFAADRPIGPAAVIARLHEARGVDELVLLDVDATRQGRGPDLAAIRGVAELLFTPFAAGGGVRSVDDARALLDCGADKVVVGSAKAAHLVPALAARLGGQSVVVTLDHRGEPLDDVALHAIELESLGAGEILLQSVARDGTMTGYDLDLIDRVCEAVRIPVVASGGAGSYADMALALEAGASAVAAGAMFAFTEATPAGAATYLAARGWRVRTPVLEHTR